MKKLYKSRQNKVIAGVCGGLADYFEIDPTIIRLIAAILGLCALFGVVVYIVAALVMPFNDD